jgi:hypothetical protein
LSSDQFILVIGFAALAAIGACWVLPKKAAVLVPAFLIRSKFFNWLVILALVGGWLFVVLATIYVANEDISTSSTSGSTLGVALIIAVLYGVGLGALNLIAATWAWLCLWNSTTNNPRGLNIAQLVLAAPGALMGIAAAVLLLSRH